ncbi:unnamed protein product [Ophioblennius macclurei]
MIATGGLLRINARRQDSLRSKPHKPHGQKKRRKRRSEVVVVKGKLKLCSLSGLVAVLGILVLMVGVAMAALGYWPRDGLFFSIPPQEGAAMASVASDSLKPAAGAEIEKELNGEPGGGEAGEDDFNQTIPINGTMGPLPRGFLEDFLDRYLYSDWLKVLGPLIMGIGIFLFICANAVLHENRDRKTKIISLRDIYSTVIDLHSSSSGSAHRLVASPLNGLVNYVQSRSLEVKPRAYPASLMSFSPSQQDRHRGEVVFSVSQEEQLEASAASSTHTLPLPLILSPTHYFFTLPLCRPRPAVARRRHSARAGSGRGSTAVEEEQGTGGGGQKREEEVQEGFPLRLSSSTVLPHGGSQAMLLLSCSSLNPSQLSLSSMSRLICSASSLAPPTRRRSLPTSSLLSAYAVRGTPGSKITTSNDGLTEELFS